MSQDLRKLTKRSTVPWRPEPAIGVNFTEFFSLTVDFTTTIPTTWCRHFAGQESTTNSMVLLVFYETSRNRFDY